MSDIDLTVSVDVNVAADLVWRRVTDWGSQGEWMLGTRVTVTAGDGRSVGSRLAAFTGVGPVGFIDTMEVVEYVEGGPWRAVVAHTGKVVRGDGVFEVVELGPRRCRLAWTELLELPLGALGRAGWPLVRPVFREGVAHSLRKLARLCEAEHRARGTLS
ncbi:MAG: SRPBCC family protein [Pseudonocardia sp.]